MIGTNLLMRGMKTKSLITRGFMGLGLIIKIFKKKLKNENKINFYISEYGNVKMKIISNNKIILNVIKYPNIFNKIKIVNTMKVYIGGIRYV